MVQDITKREMLLRMGVHFRLLAGRYLLCLLGCCFFIGCDEDSLVEYPGSNSHNLPDRVVERWWDDEEGLAVPEGTISVSEAVRICRGLKSGESTSEFYYVRGLVHSMISQYTALTGATFYMVDSYTDLSPQFEAFRIKNFGNRDFIGEVTVYRGNWVVVYCQLTNYNGTCETASGSAYLYSSTYRYKDENVDNDGSYDKPFSVEEVNYLGGRMSERDYYVRGYIIGVSVYGERVRQDNLQLLPDGNGGFSSASHYLLASDTMETEVSKMIVVQLPQESQSLRDSLKLSDSRNVRNLWHKELVVYGRLGSYLSINGVIDCTFFKVGEKTWGRRSD